ncbi:MAG TPA: type II secretion system protein GspM [Candidatus Acidoferrum sp.]|nr:type II secretion system protein GspM [Candidatus Acidoferrum sp.]
MMKLQLQRQWRSMEPRQQIAAVTVTTLVALAVVATLLWHWHAQQRREQQRLSVQMLELAQVQTLVRQYDASHADRSAADDADLSALVSRSLQDAGLQPTRLLQNSADELQLRFDAVPYADIIGWLGQIERNASIALVRVTLTQGANGTAGVSLSLRKRQ